MYLIIMIFMGNHWNIVLTLFSCCGNCRLSPHRRGILKKNTIAPLKVIEKLSLEMAEMERGSRGCSPWTASPSKGERGSPS